MLEVEMVEAFRIIGLKERAKLTAVQRAENLRQFTQAAFLNPGATGGKPMGFFSSLVSGAGRLVRGFLGIPAAAAAAPVARLPARALAVGGTRLGRVGRAVGGAVGLGGAFAVGEAGVGALIGDGDGGGGGVGGNGRTFRRTIIQTVDSEDGAVLRQEVRKGAPFLMRTDIITANRVFRVASKLHGKLPRRTVKESRVKALTTRVVESALDRAAACPTTQHNGG